MTDCNFGGPHSRSIRRSTQRNGRPLLRTATKYSYPRCRIVARRIRLSHSWPNHPYTKTWESHYRIIYTKRTISRGLLLTYHLALSLINILTGKKTTSIQNCIDAFYIQINFHCVHFFMTENTKTLKRKDSKSASIKSVLRPKYSF